MTIDRVDDGMQERLERIIGMRKGHRFTPARLEYAVLVPGIRNPGGH